MEYIVTYCVVLDGQEHESSMTVEAGSAEEACKLVRDIIKEETGLDFDKTQFSVSNPVRDS